MHGSPWEEEIKYILKVDRGMWEWEQEGLGAGRDEVREYREKGLELKCPGEDNVETLEI